MKLRIGSRGSKLAVTQAHWVGERLRAADAALDVSYVTILTSGDQNLAPDFKTAGGKGLFVKEIESALLNDAIDLAVHSLKDMPQALPPGLVLGPTPQREDTRDAVVSRFGELLGELPKKSTVGTSSIRRKAQILHRHAKRGYNIEPLRGNVDTRLKKLQDGQYDAIVVALAGLKRLGLDSEASDILDPLIFLPAPCQGALALQHRESQTSLSPLLRKISDPSSDTTARAERAFLQGLGGDCDVPVGAFSVWSATTLKMKAQILSVDGQRVVDVEQSGSSNEPELVGYQLAERLLHDGGAELLHAAETAR
jgi:hydroxymethylbilane synthase